jgi:hypothetical protein
MSNAAGRGSLEPAGPLLNVPKSASTRQLCRGRRMRKVVGGDELLPAKCRKTRRDFGGCGKCRRGTGATFACVAAASPLSVGAGGGRPNGRLRNFIEQFASRSRGPLCGPSPIASGCLCRLHRFDPHISCRAVRVLASSEIALSAPLPPYSLISARMASCSPGVVRLFDFAKARG